MWLERSSGLLSSPLDRWSFWPKLPTGPLSGPLGLRSAWPEQPLRLQSNLSDLGSMLLKWSSGLLSSQPEQWSLAEVNPDSWTPSTFWMLESTFSAFAELITSKIWLFRSFRISYSFLVTWVVVSLLIILAVSTVISLFFRLLVLNRDRKSSLVGLTVCSPLDSRSSSVSLWVWRSFLRVIS